MIVGVRWQTVAYILMVPIKAAELLMISSFASIPTIHQTSIMCKQIVNILIDTGFLMSIELVLVFKTHVTMFTNIADSISVYHFVSSQQPFLPEFLAAKFAFKRLFRVCTDVPFEVLCMAITLFASSKTTVIHFVLTVCRTVLL